MNILVVDDDVDVCAMLDVLGRVAMLPGKPIDFNRLLVLVGFAQ